MIRPVNFGFNAETAVNNAFQIEKDKAAQQKAEKEFDGFVKVLLVSREGVKLQESFAVLGSEESQL